MGHDPNTMLTEKQSKYSTSTFTGCFSSQITHATQFKI